jgi:hypothetical protein
MRHGVVIWRRLGVEAGRRCGGGVVAGREVVGVGGNPGGGSRSFYKRRATHATLSPPHLGDIMSRTDRALVMLALCLALATATTAVAVAAPPPTTTSEDQNDRLLRHLRVDQAAREQAAVELARSMERSFVPASTADRPAAAQPDAPAGTATPGRGVDVLGSLLVGLVVGLVGGAAAMAGWTATTRRRVRRAASVA